VAFRCGRLRPALAWLEGPPGPSLDAGEKAVVAERPADALRDAQAAGAIKMLEGSYTISDAVPGHKPALIHRAIHKGGH